MHDLISQRWSARGFDASAPVSTADMTDILDAGRWAPTWGRLQPVRFVVGFRGDATFAGLAATLNRGNQGWAANAGALVLVCTTDDPDDAKPHLYGGVDLGLAVAQMSIQAVASGYNAHPMAGFDAEAARATFGVPADKRPLVILAIGRLVEDPSTLPEEIRERDEWERTRLPLEEVAFTGAWGEPWRGNTAE